MSQAQESLFESFLGELYTRKDDEEIQKLIKAEEDELEDLRRGSREHRIRRAHFIADGKKFREVLEEFSVQGKLQMINQRVWNGTALVDPIISELDELSRIDGYKLHYDYEVPAAKWLDEGTVMICEEGRSLGFSIQAKIDINGLVGVDFRGKFIKGGGQSSESELVKALADESFRRQNAKWDAFPWNISGNDRWNLIRIREAGEIGKIYFINFNSPFSPRPKSQFKYPEYLGTLFSQLYPNSKFVPIPHGGGG